MSKICFFEVLFCFFLFQFAFEIYNDNFDPLAQGDWREIKVEKDLALIPTSPRIDGEEALEMTQLQWNDSNNNKIDLRNKPKPTHGLNLHLEFAPYDPQRKFFLPIFTANLLRFTHFSECIIWYFAAAKLLRFTHLSEYIIWHFTFYTAMKTVQERFSFSRIVEKVISFETLFLQLSLNVARRVTKFCKKISQKIRYQDCMKFFYFESLDKKSLILFKGFIW